MWSRMATVGWRQQPVCKSQTNTAVRGLSAHTQSLIALQRGVQCGVWCSQTNVAVNQPATVSHQLNLIKTQVVIELQNHRLSWISESALALTWLWALWSLFVPLTTFTLTYHVFATGFKCAHWHHHFVAFINVRPQHFTLTARQWVYMDRCCCS